jgi:tRNA uridine 5-carboxymethylaminomethyl modification enzyme
VQGTPAVRLLLPLLTLGSSVLLITMNMGTIAQMSCNPAMGGVAKGQIVREVDALGGYSGIITDKSIPPVPDA